MAESTLYNDNELMHRIADGDEAAFKDLFYAVAPSLQKSIGQMTPDSSQAEEIIQETFIRLWLNRDQLSHVENLRAYLYRAAVNLFIMRLRQKTAQRQRERHWDAQRSPTDESLGEQLKMAELQQIINQAVRQLPDKRREIYQLSRDKGMKTAEIAAHLQIAESTVKNSISTALAFIRERLTEAGYGPIAGIVVIFMS